MSKTDAGDANDNDAHNQSDSSSSNATTSPPPAMQTAPASTKFVGHLKLGPVAFGCIWLAIGVLYSFCAFYFVSSGVIYRRIPGSVTELMFDGYSIGMPTKN
ncbi:hypothetical protein PINS_up015710 [Pythium insidiosum]|nr:hypothetical protein PINS_up015710 [Pythium insidiosum]